MSTSNNPFLQEQKKETLEPIDEDDPSVKNSQLLQSIIRHKEIAKQYDLNELFDLLDELLPALAGSSRKHIAKFVLHIRPKTRPNFNWTYLSKSTWRR